EKLHEVLISEDEARRTVDRPDSFLIHPEDPFWTGKQWDKPNLPEGFRYTSNTNDRWLTQEKIEQLISQ
ncbi:MAG: hypothetical protein PHO92_05425, partial [Candidatus Peribacteraceae bacterium]|nr:hypothetical protein [Candidatus Peribacteraceae bacterium]